MNTQDQVLNTNNEYVEQESRRYLRFHHGFLSLHQNYSNSISLYNSVLNDQERHDFFNRSFQDFSVSLRSLVTQYYCEVVQPLRSIPLFLPTTATAATAISTTATNAITMPTINNNNKYWLPANSWLSFATLNHVWVLRERLLLRCDELRAEWLAALQIANVDLNNIKEKNKKMLTSVMRRTTTALFEAALQCGYSPSTKLGHDWQNDWSLAAALRRVFRDNLNDILENEYVFSVLEQLVLDHLGTATVAAAVGGGSKKKVSTSTTYFNDERKRHLRRMMICTQSRRFQSPSTTAAASAAAAAATIITIPTVNPIETTSILSLEWAIRLGVLGLHVRDKFVHKVNVSTIDQLNREAIEMSQQYWQRFAPEFRQQQPQQRSTNDDDDNNNDSNVAPTATTRRHHHKRKIDDESTTTTTREPKKPKTHRTKYLLSLPTATTITSTTTTTTSTAAATFTAAAAATTTNNNNTSYSTGVRRSMRSQSDSTAASTAAVASTAAATTTNNNISQSTVARRSLRSQNDYTTTATATSNTNNISQSNVRRSTQSRNNNNSINFRHSTEIVPSPLSSFNLSNGLNSLMQSLATTTATTTNNTNSNNNNIVFSPFPSPFSSFTFLDEQSEPTSRQSQK